LGHLNAKVDKEGTLQLTAANDNLHEISSDKRE
jgi:hypothetical protein